MERVEEQGGLELDTQFLFWSVPGCPRNLPNVIDQRVPYLGFSIRGGVAFLGKLINSESQLQHSRH